MTVKGKGGKKGKKGKATVGGEFKDSLEQLMGTMPFSTISTNFDKFHCVSVFLRSLPPNGILQCRAAWFGSRCSISC